MLTNPYRFFSVTITKIQQKNFSYDSYHWFFSCRKDNQIAFASKTYISTEKSLFWMSELAFIITICFKDLFIKFNVFLF